MSISLKKTERKPRHARKGYCSIHHRRRRLQIEPNIVRSVESSLDNEALRLIKMLPQWKPGSLGIDLLVRFDFGALFAHPIKE